MIRMHQTTATGDSSNRQDDFRTAPQWNLLSQDSLLILVESAERGLDATGHSGTKDKELAQAPQGRLSRGLLYRMMSKVVLVAPPTIST